MVAANFKAVLGASPVNSRRSVLFVVLRLLLLALGVVCLGWAIVDGRFKAEDGYLGGGFVVPTAVGIALITSGWAIVGQWRTCVLWFSLALVGNAVTLQLISAGTALGYQHYRPLDIVLSGTNPVLLVLLSSQALAVIVGLGIRAGAIWRWLRSNFKLWQLAAITVIFGATSATVSPQLKTYLSELVLASVVQTVQLGTVVLMVWSIPRGQMGRLTGWVKGILGGSSLANEPAPGRPDRFVLILAVWVLVISAALSFFVYERHPHVPDEVAYLLQARYLASGALSMPAPPVPEAFEVYLMDVKDGEWFSVMPPGWSGLLSLGFLLRVPWLVNPLLAAGNLVLAYVFLREIYSLRTARLSVLFLAASPWFVFLGMSFMNHQLALACALVAGLGVAWARRKGQWAWVLMSGFALGLLVLVRPLEAVAIAGVVGLWAIGIGGKRLSMVAVGSLILSAVIAGSTVLAYNARFTGSPTEFPVMTYFDEHFHPNAHALGFGPDRGMGWAIDPYPGHSPRDGVINANLNTFAINVELLGWGTGSLLLAAVAVFSGVLRRSDYLMLGVIAAIFAPHFFNYFSGGPDFGARYWFLMIVPAVALTAKGVQILDDRFSETKAGYPGVVTLAVLALSVIALANFFPWRAVDKYHDYRGMEPGIRELAAEYSFGRSLVLVAGDKHPDYASAAAYNSDDLREDKPIYAWDLSPEVRAKVLRAYSDRMVWLVEGPTITGDGYKVVEGPVPAGDLLPQ